MATSKRRATQPHRVEADEEPQPGTVPSLYGFADTTSPDKFSVKLYHCPTDPEEELRLTWDGVRRQHCGFCRACKKLWPLPRRAMTAQQLRELADQRELELH